MTGLQSSAFQEISLYFPQDAIESEMKRQAAHQSLACDVGKLCRHLAVWLSEHQVYRPQDIAVFTTDTLSCLIHFPFFYFIFITSSYLFLTTVQAHRNQKLSYYHHCYYYYYETKCKCISQTCKPNVLLQIFLECQKVCKFFTNIKEEKPELPLHREMCSKQFQYNYVQTRGLLKRFQVLQQSFCGSLIMLFALTG